MTKAERQWMDDIVRVGCICCRLFKGVITPPEVHHMLRAGRRLGHLFTLPLCFLHHRGGLDDEEVTSRDHNQRRFEARYGTEMSLLEKTREFVREIRAATVGRIAA